MTETTTKTCPDCGASFDSESVTFALLGRNVTFREMACEPCRDQREINANAQVAQSSTHHRQAWETIAPRAYQGFSRSTLPESSQSVSDTVLRWSHSERGIGLSGASRSGKTFILTELMRLKYEAGHSVHMPTASDFAYSVGSGHDGDRREMIGKCLSVDLLFIDDIGNARYTDRVEKDLFHVLENRKRNLKPVFCTINGKGADLAASMSEHSAIPIVNRLRHDVCEFYAI